MPFALREIQNQTQALRALCKLVQKAVEDPIIVSIARKIAQSCASRDDECELVAIYEAVKHGTPLVPGMSKGLRYVSDPIQTDWFQGAVATLKQCQAGACAEDCDGHAVLIASLAGALGFSTGLRVWGRADGQDYEHIYAVAGFPKLSPPKDQREWLGMDSTVDDAYVGWDPPKGIWATAIAVGADS